MREGWEIKKLGEVFDLQMGKTPSRDNLEYWGGSNVWVSISDLQNKYISNSKEHITDRALEETNIRKVKANTVIMSFKLTVGRVAITTQDLYTNEAIMAFNIKEGFDLLPNYIYYYLKGYKWEGANKAVMGLTLNKSTISQNYICIPPLPLQEKIVSELDLLSGVIEKKRQQLKELDNLAQSIFYDMFGDPITNEMGWEVKKLGEVATKIGSGATPKGGNQAYKDFGISLIRSLNVHNNQFLYKDLAHIDDVQAKALNNVIVEKGDVLLNITGASVARCCIVPNDVLPARVNQHVAIIRLDGVSNIFLTHQLTSNYYQYKLLSISKGNGATREALTKGQLENLLIILPPLPLQQSFAAKVEAIEQQKALIKQSLAETETLFNSRMEYYFGEGE